VRAFVGESAAARDWTRAIERRLVRASAPDLVYAETAHAALRYVRARRLSHRQAADLLENVAALALEVVPLRNLAGAALAVAIDRDLSVYDACYVALAEAAGATLVTADRRLADAYDRVELVA
jgi:predicted nucleic acid-binding protein